METYDYYLKIYEKFGYYQISDDMTIQITPNGIYFSNLNYGDHRLDGPTVIYSTDFLSIFPHMKTKWCINNYNVTEEITKWAEENDIDLDNLTDVDKALIKLIWSDYGK